MGYRVGAAEGALVGAAVGALVLRVGVGRLPTLVWHHLNDIICGPAITVRVGLLQHHAGTVFEGVGKGVRSPHSSPTIRVDLHQLESVLGRPSAMMPMAMLWGLWALRSQHVFAFGISVVAPHSVGDGAGGTGGGGLLVDGGLSEFHAHHRKLFFWAPSTTLPLTLSQQTASQGSGVPRPHAEPTLGPVHEARVHAFSSNGVGVAGFSATGSVFHAHHRQLVFCLPWTTFPVSISQQIPLHASGDAFVHASPTFFPAAVVHTSGSGGAGVPPVAAGGSVLAAHHRKLVF